jgi:hypothetical protein
LDPRFTGSNLVKGNGFLRAIKIHSMPSAPCNKIIWHVKEHFEV